jgi:hypothetical protein
VIDKAEVPFRKGKRVRYTSTGRNFLNTPTLELTGAISNTSDSVQVQYVDVYGVKATAWVGSTFLEYRDTTYDGAINTLKVKAEELKAELVKVQTAIETLQKL